MRRVAPILAIFAGVLTARCGGDVITFDGRSVGASDGGRTAVPDATLDATSTTGGDAGDGADAGGDANGDAAVDAAVTPCNVGADCPAGSVCCLSPPPLSAGLPGSCMARDCSKAAMWGSFQLCASTAECLDPSAKCSPLTAFGSPARLCRGPSASEMCAATCSSGCCDMNGACLDGGSDYACGGGGTLCQNCRQNLSFCIGGRCGYDGPDDGGFVSKCAPNACADSCTRFTFQSPCCRADFQCGCQDPFDGGCP